MTMFTINKTRFNTDTRKKIQPSVSRSIKGNEIVNILVLYDIGKGTIVTHIYNKQSQQI